MKQIKFDDWTFDIDIDKTLAYYRMRSSLSEKTFLKRFPESLKDFLTQCGVDYEKPCENRSETYNIYYVYGTAHDDTGHGYELDFYDEDKYASIVIYIWDSFDDGTGFSMQIFS